MALRCFLFSADDAAAEVVCEVLAGLEVEGESCSDPGTAGEKIAREAFQIVVIDWDQQPQAGILLTAARERKAAERPLTLAMVSDDASVPQALQAGANSILRKPILFNQAKDTLATARDLLRARHASAAKAPLAAAAAAAAAAAPSPTLPARTERDKPQPLRAGEFLRAGPVAPGHQFETEPDAADSLEQPVAIDPLKDLEPVAAAVTEEPPPLPEKRGLEWYKARAAASSQQPSLPEQFPAPSQPGRSGQPELLGYDQTPADTSEQAESANEEGFISSAAVKSRVEQSRQEAEPAADLDEGTGDQENPPSQFRLGKTAIFGALVLAACAIAAAPQAPWHPKMQALWSRGQRSLHAWLNPQPVTTPQAPTTHEDFGRAGDEYKLPAAEPVPDATTDPSQIQVLPAVDPTKKPAPDATGARQPQESGDGSAPAQSASPNSVQVVEGQPLSAAPATSQPAPGVATPAAALPTDTQHATAVASPAPLNPPAPKRQPAPQNVPTTKVPSSLQSQMVSMTPEASGNKPPEAAMPSIEPVAVTELAERSLLTDQPALQYPLNAGTQQGTVILQVLIGRDGAVQDAKFLQGSLAFARSAIEGVKQWKFKPYSLNGRAVSVQTTLTLRFKPGQ